MNDTLHAGDPVRRVVALCGGVGGSKLALGLASLGDIDLTVIVNTGDDFEHLGLLVSPDIDTVIYTLAGLSDQVRGWGRNEETWNFMEEARRLGEDDWFLLGDRDLAMHVARSHALRRGTSLSEFTERVASRLGIAARIVPMSDDPVRTVIDTHEGPLAFQHYFVGRRCEPRVSSIRFTGAEQARLSTAARRALSVEGLDAIVICPSNPFLSVDPLFALKELRNLVRDSRAPVVAVSPIVGGQSVKGPTTKIMQELGLPITNEAIAAHYAGLVDGLVVDRSDLPPTGASIAVSSLATLMLTLEDKTRLAREVLSFADSLAPPSGHWRRM